MVNVASSDSQVESILKEKRQEVSGTAHPTFLEAFRFWLKLGFISFGGPTGQIAIMHQELVDRKKWVSNERFLNALNYCMLLPGPEAQQLAIYIGWLLHRIPGGMVAGALFVIPSIFVLLGLSYVYAAYGNLPWIASIFDGLKPAVMAIVAAAVVRIGKKALKNDVMVAIAAAAFTAIFFFKIPFPVIVLSAGLIGLAGGMVLPEKFHVVRKEGEGDGADGYVTICPDPDTCHIHPSRKQNVLVVVVFAFLWMVPSGLLYLYSSGPTFFTEAVFFTKAAFLTFGGAYAVLPYIAQAGVEQYSWLTTAQMMDGLGLAETTPGPLIMVVQFIGFMAGWNRPGTLSPVLGATIGSLVATYFTFLPCFLFIFLGAPYIEKFRENVKLSTTLSGITAAVVGVVLNLAVWFGIQ
ncbi:MAG TPA: chromate efflux transporter, partial [Desulfatiglandales bacterium]|nr:chromate efflux transporter [Desulfatiglandales bacterium]